MLCLRLLIISAIIPLGLSISCKAGAQDNATLYLGTQYLIKENIVISICYR